jgi:hypothetical protein
MSDKPKWEGGQAPEEPDTCVFGTDGLLFGRVVGSPGYSAEERLAMILTAVNSHAAILAALKQSLAWLKLDHKVGRMPESAYIERRNVIRDALLAAEPQGENK